MFFIFYKVEVNNEFRPLSVDRRFRIDSYFSFINFQFYILHSGSAEFYITFYVIFTCLFVVYLITMLGLAKSLFKQERSENIK